MVQKSGEHQLTLVVELPWFTGFFIQYPTLFSRISSINCIPSQRHEELLVDPLLPIYTPLRDATAACTSVPIHLNTSCYYNMPVPTSSGWWFQIFVIFTPTSGNDPIWLIFIYFYTEVVVVAPTSDRAPLSEEIWPIFLKWVETTD